MNDAIFISGTPCTGKTTVSEVLSDKLNCRLVKINDLAIENGFVLGIDEDKGYKVIDIDKLNEKVNEMMAGSDEFIIFEGHLAHLCDGADKVIVLRVHPDVLRPRLEARKYSQSKIRENLEAEAMGVCTAEAYEIYGDDVQEIDSTELSIEEIVDLISGIIAGEIELPVGEIDFMDWLISVI